METLLNFEIRSSGKISDSFLNYQIETFDAACAFISALPYGRNPNKKDLSTIFTDQCGTCSTKHAILKTLADENGYMDIQLMMGIFKMNIHNTPKIATILTQHQLDYIPEAHNYLKWQGTNFDFTHIAAHPNDFENVLLEETTIQPQQITDYKVKYHQHFLNNWLQQQNGLTFTIDVLWDIREQCIAALSV